MSNKKKLIIWIFLIFFSFEIALLGKYVFPQTIYGQFGEQETFHSLYVCNTIKQKIPLSDITQVKIYCWGNFNPEEAKEHEFEILCTDGRNTYKKAYNLSIIQNDTWIPVIFRDFDMHTMQGDVEVQIRSISLEPENDVILKIMTDPMQCWDSNVVTDIGEYAQSSLYMAVRNFRSEIVHRYILLGGLFAGAVMGFVCLLAKYAKKAPLSIFVVIYVFVRWLKMDITKTPISGWIQYRYAVSYEDGIFLEVFLGNLFNWFVDTFNDHNTKIIATVLMFVELVAFLFLFSIVPKIADTKKRTSLLVFSGIFIASPFFMTTYFTPYIYGFYDAFIIAVFIVGMILAYKKVHLYLIPILSVIGVLSYKQFVFCCFPILFLYLLYQGLQSKNKNFFIVAIVNLFVCAIAAIITQFKAPLYTPEMIAQSLQERVAWNVGLDAIHSHYFSTLKEALAFVHLNAGDTYGSVYLYYFTIILLLPILLYWKDVIKRYLQTTNRLEYKLLMITAVLSSTIVFATFLIQADWCRYTTVYATSLFVMIFLLLSEENSEMYCAIDDVHQIYKEKYGELWFLLLGIYLFSISYGGGTSITQVSDISETIMSFMQYII